MLLTRAALHLTRWTSRWVPSAFTIAALLTLMILILGVTVGGGTPLAVLHAWGAGFWALLKFGMQMSLIVFLGYLVAVSPPLRRVLDAVARLPRGPISAVVAMALTAMAIAWFHWGLGLIASAVLVGFMAKHQPKADYRLLVAVSYFGLGATWHAGPSGSVPLLLATPDNFLIKRGIVDAVIPVSQTIFTVSNLVFTAVVALCLAGLAALLHPKGDDAVGVDAETAELLTAYEAPLRPDPPTPADRLEYAPWINLLLGGLGLAWLVQHFVQKGFSRGLDLNVVNFAFLAAAVLLHRSPASLVRAAKDASAPLHGIVLQFPLYAGMFGVIRGTALSEKLAAAFVSVASPRTFPLITFWYSGILNYFVPSGGSKWAIEAPYLLAAGKKLGVSTPAIAMAYAYGDMSTNLIQPFWAIPLLAVARLEFSDILGYEVLAFLLYALLASGALMWFF